MKPIVFLLAALFFSLLSLLFFLVGRLNRRLGRLAQVAKPSPAVPTLSISTITQSREFGEAVRSHVLSTLDGGRVPVPRESSAPKPIAANPEEPTSPTSTPLTERETGLLDDLLKAASLRIELAGAGNDCAIYIPEINRQFQQDYTREDCEALARKLVATARMGSDLILRKGDFICVRNLREGITRVDISQEAIPLLRTHFFK